MKKYLTAFVLAALFLLAGCFGKTPAETEKEPATDPVETAHVHSFTEQIGRAHV